MSDAITPDKPEITGQLIDDDFLSIFKLCSYIDNVWELSSELASYETLLKRDLGMKTSRSPSYLTEYISASKLINLTIKQMQDEMKAFGFLLFADFSSQDKFKSSRLDRARSFVFSEIITHQIAISGFKSFGLTNYKGYFGGHYTVPTSYRQLEI